jgi:hypothetical protein
LAQMKSMCCGGGVFGWRSSMWSFM